MKSVPARIKPCDATFFKVTCLFSCVSYEDSAFSYSRNLIVWNGLSIVPAISMKTEESSNYLIKIEFICQNSFSPTEIKTGPFIRDLIFVSQFSQGQQNQGMLLNY